MIMHLSSRKEIWSPASRAKAKKWINWLDVEPYRYDDLDAIEVSYCENEFQPFISFSASRFPQGKSALFELRAKHTVCFLFSPSGDLLHQSDTFDDCSEVFATTEFIAIAPNSRSCWSNQEKYPSDSMLEAAECSRAFSKAFLAHRQEEARVRPELDEKTHLREGQAFNLFRKQLSYLGEKPLTFIGTIDAHVRSYRNDRCSYP